MDKSTDVIQAIERIAYFYKHESCGQCTPCREGTAWLWNMLGKFKDGDAKHAQVGGPSRMVLALRPAKPLSTSDLLNAAAPTLMPFSTPLHIACISDRRVRMWCRLT